MNNLLLENKIASFDYNIADKIFTASENLSTILQLDENDVLNFETIKLLVENNNKGQLKKALIESFNKDFFYLSINFFTKKKLLKYFEVGGRILYDTDKKPTVLTGLIKDVTKQHNLEIALQDNEERYRILADFMPQFVWMSDKEGNLHYFNKAVFDYTGFTYEQLMEGAGWLKIIHPDDKEENIRKWMNAIETGNLFLFEHRFKHKNGDYRWQLSRAVPQKNEKGEIITWIGTSTDIDDIKKEDLQKNNFIKIASHELKTPVSTIKGYTQILAKGYENSEDITLITSLNVINNQVDKLNTLIGDLLDLTKIELGSLPLTKEVFTIQELIKDCLKDLSSVYPTKIFIEEVQSKEILIEADKNRIYQVLANLITNAIKYSLTDNRVTISAKEQNNNLVLSIQDFGIGIEKSEQENIFKQFYRVPGLSEKTFPGFGIGLYIVADIVARHGGKINLESEINEGSTFFIILPLNNSSKNES